MRSPQGRRRPRRAGRASSDAERRALAKAGGRHARPAPKAPREGAAVLWTDGGSRGNPGPAAIGYVLTGADGAALATRGEAIGVAGANVAEYRALIAGLERARALGLGRVDVRCDARLVVEQVTGSREPANPRLRELCAAVRSLAEQVGSVRFTWAPAEANGRAHGLVAEALAPARARLSPRLAEVVEALPLRPASRVLEIGCGTGAAARAVAARVTEGHVLGIDRSATAIRRSVAASAAEIATGRLSFRQVAAEDFALEAGEAPFDLVFAVRVGALDGRHPRAGEAALRRIAAATTAGARLFVDGGDPLRELALRRT